MASQNPRPSTSRFCQHDRFSVSITPLCCRANFTELVSEAKRVLKPGGTLCFNHITPEQVDTYWFLQVIKMSQRTTAQSAQPVCAHRFLRGG